MKRIDPTRALAIGAGLVIVALTAAAFWLSYAHLAEVALGHGLKKAPERAWAWPATLDLFIVAGELLMLRAALLSRVDWWAIGLTVAGSGSSIALNVAGVGSAAEPLDYVVAAVPPTAALLAFGALMRQVHQALAGHPGKAPEPAGAPAELAPEPDVTIERVPVPEVYPQIEVRVPEVPQAVPLGVRPLLMAAPCGLPPVVPELVVEEPMPEPEVHVPCEQGHPWCATDPTEYPDSNTTAEEPEDDPVYPDPLIPQVHADFPAEVPGVRRLKEKYGIGQARAQRIRDQLTGVTA